MDLQVGHAASAPAATLCPAPGNQRRHYRHKIRTLAYVNLDSTNGGILRDLSEFGIAVQATAPLHSEHQVHLRFALPNPHVRIEATGRVVWTDSLGQSGIEFLDLPQRSRRLLKEWVFTQILAEAYLFSPCDSISDHTGCSENAAGLLFSSAPRPAIQLGSRLGHSLQRNYGDSQPRSLRLLWPPIFASPRGLSRLLDGLILLCAVLLFTVMSLAMTHILPPWPVALALAGTVTAVFAAVYWFLSVVWIGTTPGQHLARLAGSGSADELHFEEDDQTRFR
jgi:hypothetical protein